MEQIKTENLSSDKFRESKKFWVERLSNELCDRVVTCDYIADQEYEKANIKIQIDNEVCEKVLNISGNVDFLTYIIMLSVFQIQCYRYVNKDFIINIPIFEKSDVSTLTDNVYLPLIARVKDETTIKKLIEECKNELQESYRNQYYPVKELLKSMYINDDVMLDGHFSFSMKNIHKNQYIEKLTNMGKEQINICLGRTDKSIALDVIYNSNLYKKDTIERVIKNYLKVLNEAISNVNRQVCELDILTTEEISQIVYEFNDTKREYPNNKTIKEVFEKELEKAGEKTAIVSNGHTLSYSQLNQQANQIAQLLRKKKITRNTIVPILCDRSAECIVAMLAIIKAGGAYLPIDEEYPEARIKYMIEDCKAKMLLGKSEQFNKLNLGMLDIELVDFEGEQILNESKSNLENVNVPEDLAYVIYTSGSTGNPKGVCIANRSVIKNTKNTDFIEVEASDSFLQVGSLSFDAAVLPIWIALLNGITLHIESNDLMMDFSLLEEYIIKNKITLVVFPTTFFNQFAQEKIDAFKNIKWSIAGGDVISSKQVSRLVERFENIKIVNGYGPTENTVISTRYIVKGQWNENNAVPIGKPVTNSTVYIMDKNSRLLPIGVPGELCVGGDGVAKGYLNREEITIEKFLENPYKKGEIIYRTGDLARWLPDGNIEFLGRIDSQVKIQGFRIELGEVEKQLSRHSKVKEAVVIDRNDEDGNKYLCGYFVGEEKISSNELKIFLGTYLPNYYIPAYIIQLEQIPLTPNGKIDKKTLSQLAIPQAETEYIAPRNDLEEKLAEIWCEILDIKKVGMKDNFFDIGGHSLKAVKLVSKIQKELNINVKVSDIFEMTTIEELAAHFQGSEDTLHMGNVLYNGEIEVLPKQEYYATSYVQKRMYAINQIDTESINYNIPGIYQVEGSFDREKLQSVLIELINRHEALRTSFDVIDGVVVQKVHDTIEFSVEHVYFEGTLNDKKCEVDGQISDFIRPFDLSIAPLIRCRIIQLKDTNILLIDLHHIISDGVSAGILMKDMEGLYKGEKLEELVIQYKDFSNWQNKLYETGAIQAQEEYWCEIYSGEIPILNMPTDYKRTEFDVMVGNNVTVELERPLVEEINKILKKTGTTKYMFYLAAFNILLSKYSGQDDIIIGSPTAGRTHSSLENTLGMFVNTVALRNHPQAEKSFNEFLQQVKVSSIQAFENQDYELQLLIDKLNLKKEKNRNLLFDVLFSVENLDDENIVLGDAILKRYDLEYDICKFDISLDVFQSDKDDKNVVLNFNYNSNIFRAEKIDRLAKHYINIIKAVTENLDVKIEDLDIVDGAEKALINDFNMTDTEYSKERTIHQLFEEQVLKTPHSIAVSYGNVNLTYDELNKKANSLAHLLREKEITRESTVAIMVNRSQHMVIGVLAVIKAGGAYVPIDSEYPKDRIEYMLNDCNAKLVLTEKVFCSGVYSEYGKEFIDIEDEKIYSTAPDVNLENINRPNDLMYVIYTSGTTGRPKGVMVEHKNVVNISRSWIRDYKLREINVKLLQMASFSFDVFTGDLCRALLCGGQMFICPKDVRLDPEGLYNLINSNGVSILESTPGLILEFMNYVRESKLPLNSIKILILGSDICKVEDFNSLYEQYGNIMRIINSYGITETTIDSSFFELKENTRITTSNVPIGKPMQNTKFYILDNKRNMVPIGVYGELYIGGDGVARGYLNNDEQTSEHFLDNPYKKGTRIYKTGDMARWLSDGNIELMGRIDNQVKISGFRIELGEIENQLLKHEKVNDAVVIVKKLHNGSHFLVGFVTGDNIIEESELKVYLKLKLAYYMVPTAIIRLDKMPLTPNGKVDRKLLSEMDVKMDECIYIAPRNGIEEKLAKIWGETLGIAKVGINDDFFALGGHSLKAVGIVSKIHKEFNIKIKVADIFESPTIYGLSGLLHSSEANPDWQYADNYEDIPRVENQEYYETSAVQKRMYAINQIDTCSTNYNMPDVFIVKGKLDYIKLENAMKSIIKRHEAFRTSFHVINGEIVQKIHEDVSFELESISVECSVDGRKEVYSCNIEKCIKAFDLSKAPLIRATVIELEEADILVIDTHHIIGDGVSTGIVLKELIDIYEGRKLDDIQIQYKDFAAWQNRLYETGAIKKHEEFWLESFSEEIPVLNLPTDYKRPTVQKFEGCVLYFELEQELTEKINNIVNNNCVTKFMFFLSIYTILLSKYSGQEDIVVGNPAVGRTHAELYNTVGMFLNTLPLRNAPLSNESFRDFLMKLKENSLKAFEHQDFDLSKLMEVLSIKQSTDRNPLFDVMFTLQNSDGQDISIGEATLETYLREPDTSKFDLSLFIFADENSNKGIKGLFEYKTSLYKKETIERMFEHFKNILNQIIHNIDVCIGDIDLLAKEESNTILNDFNKTSQTYLKNSTIKQLFEMQVVKAPENIAVLCKNSTITYKELNNKANQLALFLRTKGIKRNDAVGILMERSIETIITVLAINKSGGACLPISIDYPENRVKNILEDSKSQIIIASSEYKNRIAGLDNLEVICIDSDVVLKNESTPNVSDVNSSDDLSYIIYTSGTTGKPKGVMQTHRTLNNLINYQYMSTEVPFKDKVLQFATIGFDVFFQEVLSALLIGGQLCIINDEDKKDVGKLCDFIYQNNISTIFLPTAFLKFIFSNQKYSEMFPKIIKHIITAGEALEISQLLKAYINNTNVTLHNHYGPCETHVATTYVISPDSDIVSIPPIGKPIMNAAVYILNADLKLQPIGVPGEIYIGGDCLAVGYLDNEELTKKKFVENPFTPGERMYKTGDLARWLPDGNIEFLGRIDNQVKIRGFRVELSEIREKVIGYNNIQEAVVIVKEQENNNYIYAYYLSDRDISSRELKEYLSRELPSYMVPSRFIQIDTIPITANGKVDTAKLLEINGGDIVLEDEYVAAKTQTEKDIEEIWKQVLKLQKVGINDNFFDVGGNSILVLSMLSHLDTIYPDRVKVADIFANPTISNLARFINIKELKEKQSTLKGFKIPLSYYINDLTDDEDITFEHVISDSIYQMLNNIAAKEGIDSVSLLFSILSFVLNKITGENNISLYSMIGEKNIIAPIELDFSTLSNFTTLFKVVNTKVRDHNKSCFSLDNLEIYANKDNYSIPLLFYNNTMLEYDKALNETFDICVEIKENDESFIIACGYNCGRLKQSKVKELFDSYIKTIDFVAEKY